MLLCYHNEVKIAFNISNIMHTNNISTSIPTSFSCYLQSLYIVHLPKGSFNNYVDRILPFFDPPPPCLDSFHTLSLDKNQHF